MFFILLSTIVILKLLDFFWGKKRVIELYRKLKNDIEAYPIIGHGYLFLGTNEDRMTAFRRLGRQAIKHDGLARMLIVHKFFVMVADAEIAEVVFRQCLEKADDIRKLAQGLLGNGSIFATVPIWRRRRKMLSPAFALKNLNEFVPIFDKNSRKVADQLSQMAGQGDFPVLKYIARFTMDSICETTLDFRVDALNNPNQPFLYAFEEYCRMLSRRLCSPWLYNETVFTNLPWYRKVNDHIKYMHEFIDQIIRAKRKALEIEAEKQIPTAGNGNVSAPRRRTLLDLLISPAGGGEGCTDEELREELLVITLAGTDTSATGVAFVLMMLALHQRVQDAAWAEVHAIFGHSDRSTRPEDLLRMRYLDAVIKETLRLYPPGPILNRKADKDVTLPSGMVLPKDTEIILNLWAMHRNPRHWGPDAEEFDPNRFLNGEVKPVAFSAFSYGPRNCLGYQYTKLSMKTVISTILRRYRILPRQNLNLEKKSLRVKFDIILKDVDNFTIRLEKRI